MIKLSAKGSLLCSKRTLISSIRTKIRFIYLEHVHCFQIIIHFELSDCILEQTDMNFRHKFRQ